jgi:hypothetical protein
MSKIRMSGVIHLFLLYVFVYLTGTFHFHVFTKVKFVSIYWIFTEILVCSLTGCKAKFHPKTGHEEPEGEYSFTVSLTSAVDGVDVQRHAPAALHPGKHGTPCIGDWVGPRAGLDV